jgi:methyl-accepting chemotaxis protein
VRRQLRLAFAVVIVLSFLSTALAVWRLQVLSQETLALARGPQAKERLVGKWLMNVTVSIKRTAAVVRSNDPDLAKALGDEMQQQSVQTSELQRQVGELLAGTDEKALFDQIVELRGAYLQARDRITALKAEGKADEGHTLYEQTFVPVTRAYADKIGALLALQQKSIDDHAASVIAGAGQSSKLLTVLCLATLVASVAAGTLFARSLFRRLGGEPAQAMAVANAIADGNLRVDVPVAPGDRDSLMAALAHMQGSLAGIVGEVRSGAVAIGESLAVLSSEAQDLARRTESQAAALEETASSMEELTQTIGHSAASAEEASRLADDAARVARQGGTMVGDLVDTMGAINASSARIVDIIAVIDGIAFQTNILALNAAVEAARAGEQGRGFAVVAGEVRALAQRSASAAKEIKGLIDDSTVRIAAGSTLASQAGDTMRGIVDGIARVSGIMTEILASSREQASGIAQVNGAVFQMDGMSQEYAALVEESAAATRAMHEQAAALEELVARFDVDAHAGTAPRTPATPPAPSAPARRALPAALAPKPTAKTAAKTASTARAPAPPASPKPAAAAAGAADDWEEF